MPIMPAQLGFQNCFSTKSRMKEKGLVKIMPLFCHTGWRECDALHLHFLPCQMKKAIQIKQQQSTNGSSLQKFFLPLEV